MQTQSGAPESNKAWATWVKHELRNVLLLAGLATVFASVAVATMRGHLPTSSDLELIVQAVRDAALLYVALRGFSAYSDSVESRREHDRRLRVTSLHARRMEVIGEVYRRLAIVERDLEATRDFQAPDAVLLERLSKMGPVANDLRDYFQQHRIWLDPEAGQLLDELWQALKAAASANGQYSRMMVRPRSDSETDEEFERLYHSRFEIMEQQVKPAKAALERKFRKLTDDLND